jgi:hypothetical protein
MMKALPILAFVLLSRATTVCQVASGTVVIVDFTKDKIVVAADSRGAHYDRALPSSDKECKISMVGGQTLVATSGGVKYLPRDPRDPVHPWTSTGAANEAFEKARIAAHDKKPSIDSITAFWAQSAVTHWSSLNAWDPSLVSDFARVGDGLLTAAFFAQVDEGNLQGRFVLVTVDASKRPPIRAIQANRPEGCWSCGRPAGETVCAFGHAELVAEICTSTGWRNKSPLKDLDAIEATTLGLAKMSVASDLSGFVGGPVDMLELRKNGTTKWLRRKSDCAH